MSNYIMDLRKVVGHAPLLQAGASIIIENENGQVLLEKRTDNHQWGYAGGSIELGETVEEAAKRELFEEMGLVADEMELFYINSGEETHYIYPNGDEVYNVDNSTFGLSHVDFTYLPPVITEGDAIMPIVLKDYSLMIRKGEFVAFTGPSGCGKSTVLKLMMGLYTVDAGEVYGCDRLMFAYVPQGNQLMSGSIRDIILMKNFRAIF